LIVFLEIRSLKIKKKSSEKSSQVMEDYFYELFDNKKVNQVDNFDEEEPIVLNVDLIGEDKGFFCGCLGLVY